MVRQRQTRLLGEIIRDRIGPFARTAASRLEPAPPRPAAIFTRPPPHVFSMVVELCIILALALGFAAGLVVGRCCWQEQLLPSSGGRGQTFTLPPKHAGAGGVHC